MLFLLLIGEESKGICYEMEILTQTHTHIHKKTVDRLSKNRQEEENTITFRLKCIVIA